MGIEWLLRRSCKVVSWSGVTYMLPLRGPYIVRLPGVGVKRVKTI